MITKSTIWSELINYDDYYQNVNDIEYKSESNQPDNDKLDINLIDFNINNENVINKINLILEKQNLLKKTSLEILKNQNIISSCITKNFQNIYCTKDFLIKCLQYLKDTSKYLADKIKQKIFTHNINPNEQKIIRSSYKFCNYKSKCTYNYDKNKPGCFADHYPHAMIYADCDILINYINSFDCLKK